MTDKTTGQASRPTFRRYGGNFQLVIETLDDLRHLPTLVDSRWMATSCPLFGLRADPAFLTLLDSETNGRILSDEIRAAVDWLLMRLRPDESWTRNQDYLPLRLLDDSPAGRILVDTAEKCLATLERAGDAEITLKQVRSCHQQALRSHFNGDGILPAAACTDPDEAALVRQLTKLFDGPANAVGIKGIDGACLDRFEKEGTLLLEWLDRGRQIVAASPWGEGIEDAAKAIQALHDKVEGFFAQGLLARFDPSLATHPSLDEEERARLADAPYTEVLLHLQGTPLAPPAADGRLPLGGEALNPIHRAAVQTLYDRAVAPMLGHQTQSLDREEWRQLLVALAPYTAWRAAKPQTPLETLDAGVLRAGVERHTAALRRLVQRDREAAVEIEKIRDLEKLLLLHQWLFVFVNNFASFPYLFQPESRALFEMGRLVLEGRRFEFCVEVENVGQHAELARHSGIYLLYVQLSGPLPADNIHIATPVTRGPTQGYYVGRRGVFFTVDGRELDATIVKIVENPVSFWESLKAPLRFMRDVAGRRFDQLSTSVQKEAEVQVGGASNRVEGSLQEGIRQPPSVGAPPPDPVTRPGANTRDIMIGFGFLAAGLGTALKFLADTARQLTNPQTLWMVLAIVSVFIAVITVLTCLSAWAKLRRRDLGGLLQASGWAVNCRLRLTWRKARFLTRKMGLPQGARRRLGPPARR